MFSRRDSCLFIAGLAGGGGAVIVFVLEFRVVLITSARKMCASGLAIGIGLMVHSSELVLRLQSECEEAGERRGGVGVGVGVGEAVGSTSSSVVSRSWAACLRSTWDWVTSGDMLTACVCFTSYD